MKRKELNQLLKSMEMAHERLSLFLDTDIWEEEDERALNALGESIIKLESDYVPIAKFEGLEGK